MAELRGWIVWPEWDEGEHWPPAEGPHWFIEAESEEQAKQIWRDSPEGTGGIDWLAAEPADAPTWRAPKLQKDTKDKEGSDAD